MKIRRDTPTLLKALAGWGRASPPQIPSGRARGLTFLAGKTGRDGAELQASELFLLKEGKIDFGGQSLYRFEAGKKKKKVH